MSTSTNEISSESKNALALIVDNAFAKGLASVIMAQFPIASLISIFLARNASSLVAEAEKIAADTGLNAGGKNTAAKVMGIVGFWIGIGYCAFWALFFFLYFGMMFFIFMLSSM